ncbi:MAG: hypothetical protein ABJD11_11800 [Gemmatimonadota bacterium]
MNPDRCNVRIATISPVAPSVGRGTSLSLSASYLAALPCRPNVPASALHWLSSSPGVVTVDSITGVVTARSSGTAVLSVHAPGTIKVLAETQVMVP